MYRVEHVGKTRLIDLQVDDQLVKMRTPPRPTLMEGEAVGLGFEESALHLFERESGLRREVQ